MITPRAQYIHDHYCLERTADGWRASMQHGGVNQRGELWEHCDAIEGADRTDVVRRARARWGHFNFRDEAEAFGAIFPPSAMHGRE